MSCGLLLQGSSYCLHRPDLSIMGLCSEFAEATACEKSRMQSEKIAVYRCHWSVWNCLNNNEAMFLCYIFPESFSSLPNRMTCAPKVKSHGADLAGFYATLVPRFFEANCRHKSFLRYLRYSLNLAYSISEKQKP